MRGRHETTAARALGRARARLAEWKTRVAAARALVEQLEARNRNRVRPLLQQLKDCSDRSENKVLRLEKRSPGAGQCACADLEQSWHQLDATWQTLLQALTRVRSGV